MSYASLDELFEYADLGLVEHTDYGSVILDCTVRQTGARLLVEGDDLDDAVDRALSQVEDQVFTINAIMADYGLTLGELRAMVDYNPLPVYEEPPVIEPIEQGPITLLAAAQPFIAVDGGDRLYLVLQVAGDTVE